MPASYVDFASRTSQVAACLTAPSAACRVSAVLGGSGAGKTTLVAATVMKREDVRLRYKGGIVWVHAGRAVDMLTLVQEAADGVVSARSVLAPCFHFLPARSNPSASAC